jgi:hypothetical protein
VAGYDSFRSIGPAMANVNATGLRTALWRGDLGTQLPLLAELRPLVGDPNRSITELKAALCTTVDDGILLTIIDGVLRG